MLARRGSACHLRLHALHRPPNPRNPRRSTRHHTPLSAARKGPSGPYCSGQRSAARARSLGAPGCRWRRGGGRVPQDSDLRPTVQVSGPAVVSRSRHRPRGSSLHCAGDTKRQAVMPGPDYSVQPAPGGCAAALAGTCGQAVPGPSASSLGELGPWGAAGNGASIIAMRSDRAEPFTGRSDPANRHGPTAAVPAADLRALARASRACCCPAKPVVVAIMPPAPSRDHPTDLLFCGHHYRASRQSLAAAGALLYDATGRTVMLPARTLVGAP